MTYVGGVPPASRPRQPMDPRDWWWNFSVVLLELTRRRLGLPTTVHAWRLSSMVCRVCGRAAVDVYGEPPAVAS